MPQYAIKAMEKSKAEVGVACATPGSTQQNFTFIYFYLHLHVS